MMRIHVPTRLAYTTFIGVDPGWSHDRFAIAVMECALHASSASIEPDGWAWRANVKKAGWVWPSTLPPVAVAEGVASNYYYGRPPDPPFMLRRLEQFEAPNAEEQATKFLHRIVGHPDIKERGWLVCLDKVNAHSYYLALRKRNFHPYGVTTTTGQNIKENEHDPGLNVPKQVLFSIVASMINADRLIVPRDLRLGDELKRQYKGFEGHLNKRDHLKLSNNADAGHDDLVCATGYPLFVWEAWNASVERLNMNPPTKKRPPLAPPTTTPAQYRKDVKEKARKEVHHGAKEAGWKDVMKGLYPE